MTNVMSMSLDKLLNEARKHNKEGDVKKVKKWQNKAKTNGSKADKNKTKGSKAKTNGGDYKSDPKYHRDTSHFGDKYKTVKVNKNGKMTEIHYFEYLCDPNFDKNCKKCNGVAIR